MYSPSLRPPFDPELEAVLAVIADQIPEVTLETIEVLRRAPAPGTITDDTVSPG